MSKSTDSLLRTDHDRVDVDRKPRPPRGPGPPGRRDPTIVVDAPDVPDLPRGAPTTLEPGTSVEDLEEFRTAWIPGDATEDLAEVLSEGSGTIMLGDDWVSTCIDERIDLVVTSRFPDFAGVSAVVPRHVDLPRVGSVTAVVGDGPDSSLAAAVAGVISRYLGFTAELISLVSGDLEVGRAELRLEQLAARYGVGSIAVAEGRSLKLIQRQMAKDSLLVVGASDGSQLFERLSSPFHLLSPRMPVGALFVRQARGQVSQVTEEGRL